jgi:hypothetical protein
MHWIKQPAELQKYLEKDRGSETVETSSHGLEDFMADAIEDEHARNHDDSPNRAVHIIQVSRK